MRKCSCWRINVANWEIENTKELICNECYEDYTESETNSYIFRHYKFKRLEVKANKKFSAYLTPEAVTCLDRLVYNACKSGIRTTQSEIISQSLISYWHSLRLTKRIDEKPLPSVQMTHYENDDCIPPCKIESDQQ